MNIETVERHLIDVEAARTTEEELRCLTQLSRHLDDIANCGVNLTKADDEDDVEARYLRSAVVTSTSNERSERRTVADAVLFGSDRSCDFVAYVFLRRYGWSETIGDATVYRMTGTGPASPNELELKAPMNSVLDRYITWMTTQSINAHTLDTYVQALDKVSDHHLVRKLLLTHVVTWLTKHFTEMDPSLFDKMKCLVVAGLSDCWSAVRSACTGKLGKLLDKFSLHQLESFFLDVVAICRDAVACWQAKEGAAMAVGVVIKRFHLSLDSLGPSDAAYELIDLSVKNRVRLLKFGKDHVLSHLPGFISSNVYDVAYRLLRHEQLSIREYGIKALSSYLMCCDFEDAVRTLEDVVLQLRRACGCVVQASDQTGLLLPEDVSETASSTASYLRHDSYSVAGSTWMNAYAAEGLLGLCTFLVKHIPSQLLLPQWGTYFSTFLLMLKHPASTVRQAASVVFKFIVSRGASNPMMLWLVLNGLSSSWHAATVAADQVESNAKGHAAGSFAIAAEVGGTVEANFDKSELSWEFSEGRLLTYELVLRFLNKNHWLYIFDVHEVKVAPSLSHRSSSILTASASEVDVTSRRIRSLCKGHLNKVQTYSGASFKASLHHSVDAGGNPSSFVAKAVADSSGAHRDRKQSFSATFVSNTVNDTQSLLSTRGASAGDSSSRAPKAVRCLSGDSRDSGSIKLSNSSSSGSLSLAACSLLQAAKVLHRCSSAGGSQCQSMDAAFPYVFSQKAATADRRFAASSSCSAPHTGDLSHTGDSVSTATPASAQRCAFSAIFEAMFVQTAECIGSCKWELRRIGSQVLPCLTETIGWYDVGLLESLWNKHMVMRDDCGTGGSARDDVLRYSSCLSLLYMLCSSAKLQQLLDGSSVSREQSVCKRRVEVERVTLCISRSLPRLLPHVATILRRSTIDRFTSAALQIVAFSATLFDQGTLGNLEYLISDMSAAIIDVTVAARPELLGPLGAAAVLVPEESRRSFASGSFLSFCSHDQAGNPAHLAECSERHLLSDVASCLPALIKKLSDVYDRLWPLLPVLAYHACSATDDLTRRAASDSVSFLLLAMTRSLKNLFGESKKVTVESLQATTINVLCRQLWDIDVKALGTHRTRPTLDLLTNLCLCEDGIGCRYLGMVLNCLCDRWLKSDSRTRVFAKPAASATSDPSLLTQSSVTAVASRDLEILSNDIPSRISCSSTSELSDEDSSFGDGDDDLDGAQPAGVDHDAIFGAADSVAAKYATLIDSTTPSASKGSRDQSSNVDGDRHASSPAPRFVAGLGTTGDHSAALSSSGGDSSSSSAWDSCDESDEEHEIGNLFSDCIAKLVSGLLQMGQSAEVERQLTRHLTGRQRSLVKLALANVTDAKTLRL